MTETAAAMMSKECKFLVAVGAALALVSPVCATAAPEKLDCSLTVLETKTSGKKDVAAEQRPIVLLVDAQAKAVTVQQNDAARALDNVTVSEHNINGYVDDLSLSIDLSSWKIALQTYKTNPDWQSIEFGDCVPSAK